MIRLINEGVYLVDGKIVKSGDNLPAPAVAREGTMAYKIMREHNEQGDGKKLHIRFDALMSHDITYVGIIQTARASGLEKFPIPYAMTNCHNSLCAVGGTINEDDHVFGLSAAKKYGGIFVPPNQAVIHQYAREAMVKCGGMILGSDSHTRYGALGTMGVGEGGPELVKQLLKNTYDVDAPEVVLVHVTGKVPHGVGPHDIAVSLVKATFANNFVNNKIMEFFGEGIGNLSVDFRNGIDVMTTETTCLSSIWETDDKVKEYYVRHGKAKDYKKVAPEKVAYYDKVIELDLSSEKPMIALPFHPSNAYTIDELKANARDIFNEIDTKNKDAFGKVDFHISDKIIDGKIHVDQGIIAGCAGGLYDNLTTAAAILNEASTGNGYFGLSVYPASMPIYMAITRDGTAAKLMEAGAIIKPAFCGPCFGAGDVPANNGFSIRHTTRNFPNREGSKPNQGQISSVALMDARSIAATAANGGVLMSAADIDYKEPKNKYEFDGTIYEKRIYYGFNRPEETAELKYGPNITDWPKMYALSDNMLLKFTAFIKDAVTTTDELIPSGETSSYRSNPLKLAEFALSRRVPSYVPNSKEVQKLDKARREGNVDQSIINALKAVSDKPEELAKNTSFGSCVFAIKPGDGSAREQAASCQKVLGGDANICYEYATKRYRSNCINWGIVPFTLDKDAPFDYADGDYVFVPNIRKAIESGEENIPAKVIANGKAHDVTLHVTNLTPEEKTILLTGCLMNYYAYLSKQK